MLASFAGNQLRIVGKRKAKREEPFHFLLVSHCPSLMPRDSLSTSGFLAGHKVSFLSLQPPLAPREATVFTVNACPWLAIRWISSCDALPSPRCMCSLTNKEAEAQRGEDQVHACTSPGSGSSDSPKPAGEGFLLPMEPWQPPLTLTSLMLFCSCCLVIESCLTLYDPVDCSTPGFPILHYRPELAQTHVHWVGDAIQPPHPLSPPAPPAFSLSQHQGLFQWVSSSQEVVMVLELQRQHQSFQWIFQFISFRIDWFSLLAVQGTLRSLLQHHYEPI